MNSKTVELIAEISTNHGGCLDLAKEFIWRFAETGADWVKFQHTRVAHLRPDDPQYAWFQRAEFSCDQFAELKAECERAGTRFLTTVYHVADVPEVQRLGLEAVKIGSGEAGDRALVTTTERAFKRVFISDGLAHPMGFLHERLGCVSRYPAPHGCVPGHFSACDGLVGWSDHCRGLESCEVAILRGARVIEKHVCLPQQARSPKCYEATVEEFKALRAFADDDPVAKYVGRWQWST